MASRDIAAPPVLRRKQKEGEVDKTLIFTTVDDDGNETPYYIENRARPNLSYGYMRRIRQVGQAEAESWMMEKVLGNDAMEALEEMDDLDPEDDKALRERIRDITMGGMEAPKA